MKSTHARASESVAGLLFAAVIALFSIHARAAGVDESFAAKVSPLAVSLLDECQYPDSLADVMGFRLCLVYGRHANVFGLDIGVVGCGVDGALLGLQTAAVMNNVAYSNGALQIGGIVNNCNEDFTGFQIGGVANKTSGSLYGAQIGCVNIAGVVCGAQVGVFNKAETARGLQIGLINLAQDMKGIQLGLICGIEHSAYQYMPLINGRF